MRSVSLAVDITNYLMLELGQPLHAFDRDKLHGPIVVRRARPGERLETLDHVLRDLDPEDIVIADSSGAISLAGTMGGLATEISGPRPASWSSRRRTSTPAGIARESRRHKLFSEASYRFERGVDRELPLRASARAVSLLAEPGRRHRRARLHARLGGRARCRSPWRPATRTGWPAWCTAPARRCCAGLARGGLRR